MGGELTESELLVAYRRYHKLFPVSPNLFSGSFIETGTYKGHSARTAAYKFHKVKTIEIYEPLYLEAKKWGDELKLTNIEYYLGDTLKVLPGIVGEQNEPSLYFIDAHISGSDSSWNGTTTVPLMNELDIILKNNTRRSNFVLCFDDLRLFNLAPDWTGIHPQSIIDKIEKEGFFVIDNYVRNDRFWCFVSSKDEKDE